MGCAQLQLQLLKAADAEGEGCGLLQDGPEGAAAPLQATGRASPCCDKGGHDQKHLCHMLAAGGELARSAEERCMSELRVPDPSAAA